MQSIYIAALVTAALSLSVWGGMLLWRSPRAQWPLLGLAVMLQLPMSILAFHGIRLPLDAALKTFFADGPVPGWVMLLYAPLTEEPAKLWPLLLPTFRRALNERTALHLATALGLGFGIGEMGLVASFVSNQPQLASLAWYQFGGFINERFLVSIMQGAFTASCLVLWQKRRWPFVAGLAVAMGLHLLGNLPLGLGPLWNQLFGRGGTQIFLSLWVFIYFMLMLLLLVYLETESLHPGLFLFGQARCPSCAVVYSRPLFLAMNFGTRRYERCPKCCKWHWIPLRGAAGPPPLPNSEPPQDNPSNREP
jgi:hypothetical protein